MAIGNKDAKNVKKRPKAKMGQSQRQSRTLGTIAGNTLFNLIYDIQGPPYNLAMHEIAILSICTKNFQIFLTK